MQAGPWRTLCASPERFLAKRGSTLHSQPIKGTVKRGANDAEDDALRDALANSEKEQAENVMIVDLVRNDLSRVAERDSVTVDELFGIHSFATVHQMISSVSCTLRPDASPLDIMRATFPMGSMTGAPKLSAMKHIAQLEGDWTRLVQRRVGVRLSQWGLGSQCGHSQFDAPRRHGTRGRHVWGGHHLARGG